jgi:prevent-host-death family protein
MSAAIGAREARARFAELLDRASRGESISITRRGEEIARIEPPRPKTKRRPGRMKGRIWMAPDFDQTPAELLEAIDRSLEPR